MNGAKCLEGTVSEVELIERGFRKSEYIMYKVINRREIIYIKIAHGAYTFESENSINDTEVEMWW